MASVNDCSSITDTHVDDEWFDDSMGTSEGINEQPIYGRSQETLALRNAYQRLLDTKQSQTVVVHGESGSGKTALIDVLRNRICAENAGYFVAGKFFQDLGGVVQEAHSAITAAFSDLCDLIAQSEGFDECRRRTIKKALGSDAQILVNSISNLSPFVGDISSVGIVAQESSVGIGKFKVACKTFLRAMATDAPVIIFLDDIQWADEGSKQLIEMFLHDSGMKNVMFILAYRDEEATEAERMLEHAPAPINIQLSNLDSTAVYQLVASMFGPSCGEEVRHLSELVEKRTAGNPFHILLFMDTIEREGLLVFNENGSCSFNVDRIQTEIMASETLADLLTRKIELLPKDTLEILKVASMLGYHFDQTILFDVKRKGEKDPHARSIETLRNAVNVSLINASKEGFIEETADGHQFTHDKLQASFQALVGEEEEDRLHLRIGRVFLARIDDNKAVYNAAVHLNRAPGFLHNVEQRAVLASINFEAAAYCEQKSAFVQAAALLQQGLDAIGPTDRWSEHNFNLTYQIMESLARMQLVVGELEACKKTTREALDHGRSVENKIKLLLIDVEVRMTGNEVEASLSTAFQALRTLGVKMPRKVTFRHVLVQLGKVKWMLSGKTDDDILNLPTTQNLLATTAVKLLTHVCAYCLVKEEVNAGIYSALLATQLTFKTGLSSSSPSAFVFYGLTELSLGNIDRGYRYGKLALAMLENMPGKEAECSTVAFALCMVTYRRELYGQLIDPLFRVANSGYQRGEILFATYALAQCFHMNIYVGTHLASAEASMRTSYDMVADLSQEGMILWFQPPLQFVLNMQNEASSWGDVAILSGEIMDEGDYFRQVRNAGHLILIMVLSLVKAEIASYFEQFDVAVSIYKELGKSEESILLSYAGPIYCWNAARTHYSMHELSGRRQYLKQGRRYSKLLRRMEAEGSLNATPLVAYLDAQEQAAEKGVDATTLHAIFDRGLNCLAESQFIPFEALLSEKAGFAFARLGLRSDATTYFDRALNIYKYQWGATAKYNWLLEKSEYAMITLREQAVAGPCGTSIVVTPDADN